MSPVGRSQIEADEIHQGKGLEVRLSLALSTIQVTVRFSSEKFLRRDDRWRHHLSPPPQFLHGTEGEGNILQSPAFLTQPTRLRTH
ncbi:hypothetical protein TNCV_1065931 [Trichonephila clavipes]|nr:hypothetical protein TNCV_1065931 [Trichonephila clavipes]